MTEQLVAGGLYIAENCLEQEGGITVLKGALKSLAAEVMRQRDVARWRKWPGEFPPSSQVDVEAICDDGVLFNGRLCLGLHDPFWCDNSKDIPGRDTVCYRKVIGWRPLSEPPATPHQRRWVGETEGQRTGYVDKEPPT